MESNNMSVVEATLYKSYRVVWVYKFGKCEASLGECVDSCTDCGIRSCHENSDTLLSINPFITHLLYSVGISGEKFEIHPLSPKTPGTFLPLRSRTPVTCNMDQVVDCSRKAEKKGKSFFFSNL